MAKSVAVMFDDVEKAENALGELARSGCGTDEIRIFPGSFGGVYANQRSEDAVAGLGGVTGGYAGGLLSALTAAGLAEDDAHHYSEALRDDSALVVVTIDERQADAARRILHQLAGDAGVDFESCCRSDFEIRFESSGYTFKQLVPAYQYGRRLAWEEEFRGKEWAVIEPRAHREWEQDNPNTWEQIKEAVHFAFLESRL